MGWLEHLWYRPWGWCIAPLGWLWSAAARGRRLGYRLGAIPSHRVARPVVVVGNIAVGGTGKTPLTVWLANYLAGAGYRPGIICAGYKGRATRWPQQVRPDSDPTMVGDEPVLLARQTDCPVAAGRDRVACARALIEHSGCDVVVSDDGLQHLALARDVEIAVVDAQRRHGNGLCMPAGPLREPTSRLRSIDIVVANGVPRPGEIGMVLEPGALCRVDDPARRATPKSLRGEPVHAVAGIGHPGRFFELLRNMGFEVIPHPFPDHHRFTPTDIAFPGDARLVIMTEKDAVKCQPFAGERHWYVPVRARVAAGLGERVAALLEARRASRSGRARGASTPTSRAGPVETGP